MSEQNIEHFKQFIEPILETATKKDCKYYFHLFRRDEEYEAAKKELISLFNDVCSFLLTSSSPNEPFKPLVMMGEKRSGIPADLSVDQRIYLASVLMQIKDSELKARVADVLWVLRHGKSPQSYAEIAVAAYITSADNLLQGTWSEAYKRLERAFRLSRQIGLDIKQDISDEMNVKNAIARHIENHKITYPYLVKNLIDLLFKSKITVTERHIEILESIALQREASKNFDAARNVWELLSKIYSKDGKSKDSLRCQINAAETYVKHCDVAENDEKPSYIAISSWLQSSVEAYQNIPNQVKRRNEIYARLVKSQEKIHNEMQTFSTEIDLTELVEHAKSVVSGQDKFLALYKLAFIYQPQKIQDIQTEVKEQMEESPFTSLVSGTIHDRTGKVIAKTQGEESRLEDRMYRHVSQFVRLPYVHGLIMPALQTIRFEHDISLNDWYEILVHHPFIPQERVEAYARGFFHGFHGDFLSACHVLIPQIENSFRHVLKKYEKETSKQLRNGLQEESGLNETLYCDEAKELFGEHLIFDLKCLLTERLGSNLRNRICHGLLDDDELFSHEVVYLYWLALHIIFIPLRNTNFSKNTNS